MAEPTLVRCIAISEPGYRSSTRLLIICSDVWTQRICHHEQHHAAAAINSPTAHAVMGRLWKAVGNRHQSIRVSLSPPPPWPRSAASARSAALQRFSCYRRVGPALTATVIGLAQSGCWNASRTGASVRNESNLGRSRWMRTLR